MSSENSSGLPNLSSDTHPIAVCMHGFAPRNQLGVQLHDAPNSVWEDIFHTVSNLGFNAIEIADSHIRPADLDSGRRRELMGMARHFGVLPLSVHVQRRSVIQPGRGKVNLEYAHRSIDAAAEMGMQIVSTGLHQPLTDAQNSALWFWSVQGSADPEDAEVRALAVSRLRDLGKHAASVGLQMSLEIYEDTYLGTSDGAVRLVEDIGLSNVGLNPDIGNLIRLPRQIEDWREAHEKTLPYANYWHMKNYVRDEAPDRTWYSAAPTSLELGLINYRSMVELALDVGFRGPFVLEQYGGDSLGVCVTNRIYLESLLSKESSKHGREYSWSR